MSVQPQPVRVGEGADEGSNCVWVAHALVTTGKDWDAGKDLEGWEVKVPPDKGHR